MVYSKTLRGAVCVAAIFAGASAQAEVTAEQVWNSFKTQLEVYGEDGLNIGAEDISGGEVSVNDISLTFADDEVTIITQIGDLDLVERGDGTVLVTMQESYPIIITGEDGVVVTLDVTQRDLELVVSGDPEAMNYAFTAESYGVAFRDAVDGDVTITGDATLTAMDVAGSYDITTNGDLQDIVSDVSVGMVDILVDFIVPGGNGEYVTAAGKISGLTSQGEATVPLNADFENPDNIFAEGFALNGGYQIAGADYVFDFNADGDQASGSASTGPVSLSAEMNAQTVAYESMTRDIALNLVASEFPVPLEVSLAEYGVNFRMPVGITEDPAPFALGFDLVDLTISDMLWDMFDPGAVLPRDPATLQIGLSGTAIAKADFLDPANADAFEGEDLPFAPYSLSLETLRIAAAGALITGSGDFVFDNTDTETFAPMPRPEGDAVIEISGLNGLLDNLVSMGLVPEDQIMGPRMMMGMFARATGDDRMEIAVEVTPSGEVKVNGNRVR